MKIEINKRRGCAGAESRGIWLFSKGQVGKMSLSQGIVNADVTDEGEVVHARVRLTEDGQIDLTSWECTCDEEAGPGFACAHAYAVAYEGQKRLSRLVEIWLADAEVEVPTIAPRDSLTPAGKLIKKAGQSACELGGGDCHVQFSLDIKGDGMRLGVKAGTYRQAPVAAWDFLHAVYAGELFDLGVETACYVGLSAFCPEDRRVLEAIQPAFSALRWERADTVVCDGGMLVALCKALDGRELEVTDRTMRSAATQKVTVEVSDFRSELQLASAESGYALVAQTAYRVLAAADHLCVLSAGRLHVCSSQMTSVCGELLTEMEMGEPLAIATEEFGAFWANVLQPALCWIDLRVDPSVELPELAECFPRLAVDLRDGLVVAQLAFWYGGEARFAFGADDLNRVCDRAKESLCEKMVLAYLDPMPAEEGWVCLPLENSERVFDLVSRGLPQMSRCMEVTLSTAFAALRVEDPGLCVELDERGRNAGAGTLAVGAAASCSVSEAELAGIIDGILRGRRFVRVGDRFFDLSGAGTLLRTLSELGVELEAIADKKAHVAFSRAAAVAAGKAEVEMRVGDRVRGFVGSLSSGVGTVTLDPQVSAPLRAYQAEGSRWLCALTRMGLGGVLADDMGLGKTLQILCAIATRHGGTALVVCPSSLVHNWLAEAEKWAPDLRIVGVTGAPDEREAVWAHAGDFDLMVTSYDLMKRDADLIGRCEFDMLCLDEAQAIKNHQTQTAKVAKSLRARSRFAITGTPIENGMAELWSIFDFALPGHLGTERAFREKYVGRTIDAADAEMLKRLMGPFLMRRTKVQVAAELPEKMEQDLVVPMTVGQARVYNECAASLQSALAAIQKGPGDSKKKRQMISAKLLTHLTRIRQICCDPTLVGADADGHGAKLELCLQLVSQSAGEGHAVLVFSQFTQMLDILEAALVALGIAPLRLDGDVPMAQRPQVVEDFQCGGSPVLLSSLKVGGTGLNLTAADTVVLYDPWWNPSVERQAVDRTHRIGQTRPVTVYRLIAKGTIEEGIQRMQKAKRDLFDEFVREGGNVLSGLSPDELIALLSGRLPE